MGCEWSDANHAYFQFANLFLAFTYLVPNTLKGLIVLRLFLGTAGFFFCMWAGIILCSPDTLGWNLAFMVINFGHVAYLLYGMRPISFDEENELLYSYMFEHLGVARWQYKSMESIATTKEIKRDVVIATEDKTDGDSVSILTSGSCRVVKNGQILHRLKPYEFLDSPEWIASTQGGAAFPVTFEVSLISEGCVIVSWQRNALLRVLRQHNVLKNIFDSVVGQDIAKKLKSNRTTSDDQNNGYTNRSFSNSVYHIDGNHIDEQYAPTLENVQEVDDHHDAPPADASIGEKTPLTSENIKLDLHGYASYSGRK